MNRISKLSIATALVAATGLASFGAVSSWGEYDDDDRCARKGPPPGAQMQMKQHMMGKHGGKMAPQDLDLTADEAKTLVAARLIMWGNDRLKVGEVATQDENTYLVDIVTLEDSLVKQVEVDRNKGMSRRPF